MILISVEGFLEEVIHTNLHNTTNFRAPSSEQKGKPADPELVQIAVMLVSVLLDPQQLHVA